MHPDAPFLALLTSPAAAALPGVVTDAWHQEKCRSRDLFTWAPEALAEALAVPDADLAPLLALRARLPAARALIDRLAAEGITLVTDEERAYPRALREALGVDRPPMLWLAGARDPLARGPIALVGERDAPMDALALACELATALAREGRSVLTGVATAFERAVLQATLAEPGGAVVALIEYGIVRALPNLRLWRQGMAEGRLLLLSYAHPEAAWEPGQEEMGGAVLAGLAERMVLVSGGSPATAYRRARQALRLGRPLLVRADGSPSTTELLAEGAHILVEPIRLDLVQAAPSACTEPVSDSATPMVEAPAASAEGAPDTPTRPARGRRAARTLAPAEPVLTLPTTELDVPSEGLEATLLRRLESRPRPVGKGTLVRVLAVAEADLDRVLQALIAQGKVVQHRQRAGMAYGLANGHGAVAGTFQPSLFSQEKPARPAATG